MKLVSVIIPTYQHAESLPSCIDSILAQSYSNIEIIVVDDGSTDGTSEAIKPYLDRVTYIHQENAGANPARNRGWKEAKGDYLLFCDADVLMDQTMIQKMATVLDAGKTDLVYCDFYFGWKHFKGQPFSVEALKQKNYIHTSSLVRASKFPGFDPTIKRLQDWDVWLTMALSGSKGHYLAETLLNVRVEGKSRIGSSWMPRFMYRLPWKWMPFKSKRIEKYFEARRILRKKHQL